MPKLFRLLLGLAACVGCGGRRFQEQGLLDPCISDGARLTVYASVERGVRETSGSAFNPTGTRTVDSVAQADLYEVEFDLRTPTAAMTQVRHVLGVEGRRLSSVVTATDGWLSRSPLPPADDAETRVLAPSGGRCCVTRRDRFVVYSDPVRTTELDAGTVPVPGSVRFTWSGERLYVIVRDAKGGPSRVLWTSVGSRGEWHEIRYDAAETPIDGEPGVTDVEAYDVLDGEPVLLLRKYYSARGGGAAQRPPRFALLRGTRVVTTWAEETPGRIQPDLRAVVGWHRPFGSLQATFTLRSLDDGCLRTWQIDARPVLDQPRR